MKSLKQRLKKQEAPTSSTEWSKYDERLIKSVENGDADRVSVALKKGAIPTKLNTDGTSALHLAASKGFINSLNLLLNHGVNLHATDSAGKTALHLSAGGGYSACVQRLLQCRSPIDSTDLQGRTALHDAACGGHGIIIKMLCESGASLSSVDMDGQSALLLAARRGQPRACQQLLNCGASSTFRDKQHKTALILACEYPSRDVVEVLLKNKADVTAVDIHGHNPYHYAKMSEDEELITMVTQAWQAACKGKEADKMAQKIQMQAPAKASSSGLNWASGDVAIQEQGPPHQSARERGGLSTNGKDVAWTPHLDPAQAQRLAPHPPSSASFRSALRPAEATAVEAEHLRRELREARRRQEAAQGEVQRLEVVLAKRIYDYDELRRNSELALQEAHGRAWELEEALGVVQSRMAGSEARVRQMQAHLVSVREKLVEELRVQRHEARAHKEAAMAKLEEAREELGQSRRELEEQRGRQGELLHEVNKLTKDLQTREEHTETLMKHLATLQARRTETACKEVQTSSDWQPPPPKSTPAELPNGTLQHEVSRKECISVEEHEAARRSLSTALQQAEARARDALQKQRRAEDENRDLLAELQDQKVELDILQKALQAKFVQLALLEEKENELARLRLIIKEMETKQRDQSAEETSGKPDRAGGESPPEPADMPVEPGGAPEKSMTLTSRASESSGSAGQERMLTGPPDGRDKGLDAVGTQGQAESPSSSSAPSSPGAVTHSDCAALQAHIDRLQQQLETSERHNRQVLSVYRTRLLSAAQGYMDDEAREALLQIAQMRQECPRAQQWERRRSNLSGAANWSPAIGRPMDDSSVNAASASVLMADVPGDLTEFLSGAEEGPLINRTTPHRGHILPL